MTSESRKQFEEWAKAVPLSVERVSNRPQSLYTDYETHVAWQCWSARDSEVETLREALKGVLGTLVAQFPHEEGEAMEVVQIARRALSSQVKESGK